MDNSDKETIQDYFSGEKSEKEEKHPEIAETKDTCQEKDSTCDTIANSQVKPKSESGFKNEQERSTDKTKESDDVLDWDTYSIAGNSEKSEKQLKSVNMPYNEKECFEEHSNQADQSTTRKNNVKPSEESISIVQNIKRSVIKYFLSATDQTEKTADTSRLKNIACEFSNNIIKAMEKLKTEVIDNMENVSSDKTTSENLTHSKTLGICLSNNDGTKIIDENILEKEVTDNEPPKFFESENTCTKCKYDKPVGPIISPGKRKSKETNKAEIKRRRNADTAQAEVMKGENSTDSTNERDFVLYADHSEESEKHLVNTVITDETSVGCIQQNIAISQADQSVNKYKIAGETDCETQELQTSHNESAQHQTHGSDNVLFSEDQYPSPTIYRSNSLVARSFYSSFWDNLEGGLNPQKEIMDESISEDKLRDSKKNMETDNLSKFGDFPENPKSEFRKKAEDKSVKYSSNVSNTNTKISHDIHLQINQNLADTNKSEVSNISRSREDTLLEETLPPQGVIGDHLSSRICSVSPVKLFSDSECNINTVYIESESKFINLDHLENDPDFVESQKRILESISQQQQQTSSMKLESDNVRKSFNSSENEDPNKAGFKIPKEAPIRVFALLQVLIDNCNSEGKDVRCIDVLTLISLLIELAEAYDPDIIPYLTSIVIRHRERVRQSPEEIKIACERSAKESLEMNDRALKPIPLADESSDKYPPIINPVSPISSPPKSEPDKISERDSAEFREYPGLAENPTGVKKDARYQKKFYKRRKPVKLPLNWMGDRPSTSEIQPNIDSEENQIPVVCDDPRIISENKKDDIHEETSEVDPKAKKDSRYEKRTYRLKPVVLPINRNEDDDSSEIDPNIDSDHNQILRIDDDRIVSEKNEDTVHKETEEDPDILLKCIEKFKEKGKSPEDKLPKTLASASEYKISSFLEESPNSSQSNSPKRDNESTLPAMLEINTQLEGLAGRFVAITRQILSSQAEPSQSPSTQAEPSQSPSSQVRPSPKNMG